MSVENLTTRVEGDSVLADLSLASTAYALLQRMEHHSTLRDVREHLEANPGDIAGVLARARRLFDSPAPAGFAHPGDLALAAYLWVLSTIPAYNVQEFLDQVATAGRREFYRGTATAKYLTVFTPETTVQDAYRQELALSQLASTSQLVNFHPSYDRGRRRVLTSSGDATEQDPAASLVSASRWTASTPPRRAAEIAF
jgi:hypothetical protein